MSLIAELLISLCLVVAGVFGLVGSFGLMKLPDTMQRLHAPTKATTLGVGGVLIASLLYFNLVEDSFSVHELLITLFLFLTAPITANFIAKIYLVRSSSPEALPKPTPDRGWAVFGDPPSSKGLSPEPEGAPPAS